MTPLGLVLLVLALVLGPAPVAPVAPASPTASPTSSRAAAAEADPRWVFYTKDRTRYRSPWYAGAHRRMIPFGCTRAPYYSPDPRCEGDRGFHHGLDLAMPCGTRLFSARSARVVSTAGLGPAYGANPLRLRNRAGGFDVVIGHTRKVFVERGDRVRPGTLLARASDSAAPDGCHLHVEKRAVKGGLSTARNPRTLLALRAKG